MGVHDGLNNWSWWNGDNTLVTWVCEMSEKRYLKIENCRECKVSCTSAGGYFDKEPPSKDEELSVPGCPLPTLADILAPLRAELVKMQPTDSDWEKIHKKAGDIISIVMDMKMERVSPSKTQDRIAKRSQAAWDRARKRMIDLLDNWGENGNS